MRIAFAKLSKLNNIVGRADYITDINRQETILMESHDDHMKYSWEEHALFERLNKHTDSKNNEGREVIFTFPDSFRNDGEKLKSACEQIGLKLFGTDIDYQYACHIKNEPTMHGWNLNVHFIFSERHNIDTIELTPKIYKKDIWQDSITHKLAKANSDGAVLVHRKGEVQLDKDGKPKYNEDFLSPKDTRFKSIKFYKKECQSVFADVMKSYGFDYEVYDYHKHGKSMPSWHRGQSAEVIQSIQKQQEEIRQLRNQPTPKEVVKVVVPQPQPKPIPQKTTAELLQQVKKEIAEAKATTMQPKTEKEKVVVGNESESQIRIVATTKVKQKPIISFSGWSEYNQFQRDFQAVEKPLDLYFKQEGSIGYRKTSYRDNSLIPAVNLFINKWKDKFEELKSATYQSIRKIVNGILKDTPVLGSQSLVKDLKEREQVTNQQEHKHGLKDLKKGL